MGQTVSDFLLERLDAWGVDRIFGYPGDGINGLMGAFGRRSRTMEFVQVRHEEAAAFMACAHAKFTGEVGVCMATSGPGAIHLLNGLYDARLDHQPVVAIVGQQPRGALGGEYQQEVDLSNLFKDVARDFVQMITTPVQARHCLDRAMRIAMERRAPTCIIVPNDVQSLPATETPREHGTVLSGIGATSHAAVPGGEALGAAAEVLNSGKRVAMLVGAGALGAAEEVDAVSDALGAGVAKALLGKAVLPDSHPGVTGSIGLLGTRPSWEMMNECDTLLMVGTAFPYTEFLPKEGQARAVQIDADGSRLNMRYPVELGLVGDSAGTLRALLPLLVRKHDRSWRERIDRLRGEWRDAVRERALAPAQPVNPQLPFLELSRRLPLGSIVTCDSGSAANWYARDVDLRPGMMGSLSGGLATMGCAVPYALAAKLAHPDRPVIALVGDGAMQMNGINELITIADRWRDWHDPTLVVMVLNNGDLNLVSWEQRVMGGAPRFRDSQALPAFSYAEYGRLLGLQGIRVDTPEMAGPAWDEALSAGRPVVMEIMADPAVPPLPPHVSRENFQAYAQALSQEDRGTAAAALRATIRQWWAG
jgi:pyruvate dehydrogenase (quinone)